MKKSTLLLLALFISFFAVAQTPVSEFGNFTAQEINLKQCEFDKEAEAVILVDKAVSTYDDDYNLITERRIRIKILKENGIERGNIRIPYYSENDFESITSINAIVHNTDGQNKAVVHTLDQKSIYRKKINNYYSEVSFALPNVKVGSIIEYKYKSRMKHYGGLEEWVFQSDIPVVLSSYELYIIPNAEFNYTVYKAKFLPIVVKPDSKNGKIYFEMSNIPGLRDEAYMKAPKDYLQRVRFQFSGYKQVQNIGYGTAASTTKEYNTTWKQLAQDLLSHKNFGQLISKDLPGVDVLRDTWEKATSPYERMRIIHDYVRKTVQWNHIYSKYADGLKEAWQKKTGTSGEVNLILLNLLRAANIESYPLLVSERDHGNIDTTYPYINQFLKVVAYVLINDKHYIIDATDDATPSFMIPFKLLNTTGFLLDKNNPRLIKISDPSRKNLRVISLLGQIDEQGILQLSAVASNYDYGRIEMKEKYLEDKTKYQKDFFRLYENAQIDSFAVDGLGSDSLPLRHNIKMNYKLNKADEYVLLNYNFFTGLDKNPFIADQRFTDIDFGCSLNYLINASFAFPANMKLEELPKNIRMVTPDRSMEFLREVGQSENMLRVGIKISINKTEYPSDAYSDVQAFFKQMLDVLNEPFLLRIKS